MIVKIFSLPNKGKLKGNADDVNNCLVDNVNYYVNFVINIITFINIFIYNDVIM